MLSSSVEYFCEVINENFHSAAELDRFIIDLGGDALSFTESMWNISMILAAVMFAIVACYELYAQAVRTEGHGGPMGTAEIVFKVMFKVAVCFIVLQVSFDLLKGLFGTFNSLIDAFGDSNPLNDPNMTAIDPEKVASNMPGSFWGNIGCWLLTLITLILSFAAKIAAWGLILIRMVQIYLYIAISPIPLATLPSRELGQIGKGFLKQFIAVCFQGALIYLVVQLFPAMVGTVFQGNFFDTETSLGQLFIAMIYSVSIIVLLMGTQQLARRICGTS